MKRKLLSLLACSIMVTGVFGCGSTKDPVASTASSPKPEASASTQQAESSESSKTDKKVMGNISFPLSDTKQELTVFTQQLQKVTDFNTNKMTEWYEDLTNVHINWIAFPSADYSTQRNLSLASGSYPDIYGGEEKSGGVTQYRDRIYLPLNDLMDQGYMPNSKKIFESYDALKVLYTTDGKLYGFPFFEGDYHMRATNKMFVNVEWLQKLGMNKPATTQEFKDMLIAFRDNDMNGNGDKTDEIPLSGSASAWGGNPLNFLMSSFQMPGSDYLIADKEGKITFVATLDTWREGLRYINDLYKERLLGEEIYVQDDTQYKSLVSENVVGAATGAWQGVFADGNNVKYSSYDYILPLKGPSGLQQTATKAKGELVNISFKGVITSSCKIPEIAAQWLDFWLSDEGNTLQMYGFEGINYELSDIKAINGITPSYNVLPDSEKNINTMWLNKTVPEFRFADTVYGATAVEGGAHLLLYEAGKAYIPYEKDSGFPLLTWVKDADQESKKNELASVINAYVLQATSEFILGVNDINDDNAWKTYCDTLTELGVDELVKIMQEINFPK